MKLRLHEHISRLLFDHECVIVPDFGAFLTRYYSAEVNHATHMMRPPSKRVYFNASIKENEGLLAKAISHTENMTYSQALSAIKSEVNEWKSSLVKKKKLNLPGIGRLYIDEVSRKLQFSPSLETNYATSSYGLSIFRSPGIQREAQIRKTIHQAIEKHVIVEHPETKSRKVASWIPWAAALGPLILAGVIGYSYLTQGSLNPVENVAGINWMKFSRATEQVVTPIQAEPSLSEEVVEETPAVTEPILEETSSSNNVPAIAENGYHIIVGSFKNQQNADSYISQLNSKGFNAYLAKGDKRFLRVAVGSYATHEQAEHAILAVKQNINSQSWIYRN